MHEYSQITLALEAKEGKPCQKVLTSQRLHSKTLSKAKQSKQTNKQTVKGWDLIPKNPICKILRYHSYLTIKQLVPTVTKAHFQFSVYQILQCLRGRKSKNKVFLDERERMRIHKIPPKLGRANAQLLDCCFLPSLSRGPNFPDWFRFYFWGQRTGEQKRGILPTQVHVKIIWYYRNTKMVWNKPSRPKTLQWTGRSDVSAIV